MALIAASDSTERIAPPRHHASRITALDGLRGVAVFMVLVVHFFDAGFIDAHTAKNHLARALAHITTAGWTGVDLFFVLSGFLITGILLNAREGAHYFRNFYMRRVLRIFPLYYASLVFTFWILPLFSAHQVENLAIIGKDQIFFWTYLTNMTVIVRNHFVAYPGVGHFWSLAVEEHFYLVWPAVVLALSNRSLAKMCAAIIVMAFSLRVFMLFRGADRWGIYMFTFTRMDALAMGGLLAVLIHARGLTHRYTRLAAKVSAAACAAIVAIGIYNNGIYGNSTLIQIFGFSLLMCFWAGVLLLALVPGSRVSSLLDRPVLRSLGKYSYGMYVIHVMLNDYLFNAFGLRERITTRTNSPFWACVAITALGIPATFALAWLSFNLFEKHFLRLKAYFDYETRTTAGAPAHVTGHEIIAEDVEASGAAAAERP